MGEFYKSFTDLMEKNKTVFRFLKNGSGNGLARAVWDSRDFEIKSLKDKIHSLEKEKEEVIKKDQRLLELEDKIKNFQKEDEFSSQIIEGLKLKNKSISGDLEKTLKENSGIIKKFRDREVRLNKMKIELADNLTEIKELKEELKRSKFKENGYIKLVEKKEKFSREIQTDSELKVKKLIREKELITNSLTKNIKEISSNFKIELLKVQNLKEQNKKLKMEIKKGQQFVENLKEEIRKVRANTKKYQILNYKLEAELFRINGDLESLNSQEITPCL